MPHAQNKTFVQAAVTAFDWLLGARGETPATGVVAAPTPDRVLREQRAADDSMYRGRAAPELPHRYAVGVANALMWARGIPGVDPPIDFDFPVAG
jgi:hypothetical protein